jgi:heptosyltransferase-2
VKKFLIIQTAFIGDVILATPLIENLKQKFPNSQIDFLVKKGNELLLVNDPRLNNVFVFDKGRKITSIFKIIRSIRSKKYDAVFNLHRFASSGFVTCFSSAKSKFGFRKNPFSFCYNKAFPHEIGNGLHEIERNLNVISEVVETFSVRPKLFLSSSDEDFVNKYKSTEFVCMAPASVWFTKQMPEGKWVELIKKHAEQAQKIYLIGGPSDIELCERILKKCDSGNVENLAGKLTLLQSAALMRDSKMNYVNDSGPLHFASALNAPVTAFFCSTTPEFGFGPLSDLSEIIEVKNLACKPCGLHGHKECPQGHFNCGNLINLTNIKI